MILKGTKFQLKVWNYLKTIPKGQVRTYLDVAKAINKPKAARAVANAVGKNPNAPKIPCHRVIRSDGSLGGYSGPNIHLGCLLYTSPSPRDQRGSRMPSSA